MPAATSNYYVYTPDHSDSRNFSYIRLGAYSDIESAAWSDTSEIEYNLHHLYPRKHIEEMEASRTMEESMRDSAGIAIACNGRLLLRSCDAFHLHSSDEILIDTEKNGTVSADGTIAVSAGQALSLASRNGQPITIDADGNKADINVKARSYSLKALGDVQNSVQGSQTTVTSSNTISVTPINISVTYIEYLSVNAGNSISVYGGGTIALSLALNLSVNTLMINFQSEKLTLTANLDAIFTKTKVEAAATEVSTTAATAESRGASATVVETEAHAAGAVVGQTGVSVSQDGARVEASSTHLLASDGTIVV